MTVEAQECATPSVTGLVLFLAVIAALICIGSPAAAQPSSGEPSEASRTLLEASDAIGSVRGARGRTSRGVLRIRYLASGRVDVPQDNGGWMTREVEQLAMEMHYGQPAMRADYQFADGERVILVLSGDLTWNETTPGTGAVRADVEADQRGWQVWSTPQGALWAALDAEEGDPDSISLTRHGDKKELRFSRGGMPIVITLDANHLPESVRVEINHAIVGETTAETRFLNYKDWELLDVLFPENIVRTMDGREVMDLTVSEFRSNPYVVFPVPDSIQ